MTDDKNESEHCEDRAQDYCAGHMTCDELTDLLLSERAAARAEGVASVKAKFDQISEHWEINRSAAFAQGDAQGYERGRAQANDLLSAYRREALQDALAFRNLQSKYDTLAAAARELSDWASQACEHIPGAVECDPSTDDYVVAHQVSEAIKAVRAALGPAPAPEEKLCAALGPDGCVTKELESLREHITRLEEIITDDCNPLIEQLEAERDSLKAEVERLTQHTKDAQKENRYLLDRVVRMSKAASAHDADFMAERLRRQELEAEVERLKARLAANA